MSWRRVSSIMNRFPPSSENDALAQTLSYFENEREKCLMLINSTTDKAFAEKLFQLPVIQHLLKKNTPQEYDDEQAKYMYTFVIHGGYAMIRQWANSENRESPQEMSLFIQKITTKLLRDGCSQVTLPQ